jgi:gliding motility-associated-like protein
MQSEDNGTFQIILHESGEIEIHLIEIPFSNYAGNETAVGIHSSNPFQGLSAPQRNYGPWPPISRESWRFRWVNSDYLVESIDYEPFAVAENIYWYELEGATGRNLIGDQQQVSVTPKLSTRYLAEITSCWGEVIASAELSVIVEGVFPTAFNPRSTEVANRTFKMPSIPDAVVANYLLQIYNRWGQLVFETNDISTGWNGRMQNTGQECPAGVYHWIMMREDNGKTPLTNGGAVMLLR